LNISGLAAPANLLCSSMREPWLNPEWRPSGRATIVFVHGAIVNGWEMSLLRRRLHRAGYEVRQFQYHSLTVGLDENVRLLKKFLDETEGDTLHVIGHSMGGILTRHVFEEMPDPRPGRLIAIGTPFLDCWVGHRVRGLHHRAYWLLGKTVYDHIHHPRNPVWQGTREFGVLAGTYPFGIGSVFPDLPQPSDGVVLWDETQLQGIRDHLTYRINHFGMLLSKRCCTQMARFLATGAFGHVLKEPIPDVVPGFSPTTAS
jgi:pimeloyl-ACP methyl ester carboxylesterase